MLTIPELILKKGEDRRLRRGHLWVFSNEVDRHPDAAPGDLVDVKDYRGRSLGSALYHPHSLITGRLLLGHFSEIDADFFSKRITAALQIRMRRFPADSCYRIVHGESDFLPGLIVDKFGPHIVVQTLTSGMDRRLPLICSVLEELLRPESVVERNDTRLRAYENLPQQVRVLRGRYSGPSEIQENGLTYQLDLLEDQKTGFFLDQKTNRAAAARYSQGARVLDCYCNTGGFALNAARAGASEVTGVDSSASAIARAQNNAAANGLSRAEFIHSDVFDFLTRAVDSGELFDLVILDPPAFARSKKQVSAAKKGYERINESACRILRPGGILVSASCSFHLYTDVFYRIVAESCRRAGKSIKILERRSQSPDHPVLPSMPETSYLKLGIFATGL